METLYKMQRFIKVFSGRFCSTIGFMLSGPALLCLPNRLNASISFVLLMN
jgi:hypothetical protein